MPGPNDVDFGPRTIAGFQCHIYVQPSGMFAVVESERRDRQLGSAQVLDDAIAAARTTLVKRKLKVAIGFVTFSGERGNAVGRHAGSGELMARMADGTAAQLRSTFGREAYFKGEIPDETVEAYLREQAKADEARDAMRAIEKEWAFDLGKAVNRAIDEQFADRENAGERLR